MERLIQPVNQSKTILPNQETFFRKKDPSPYFFQPKLTINQPNDLYEQEADAMADRVMRMPDQENTEQPFFKPSITSLQRMCTDCEEEEKMAHRKEVDGKETTTNHSLESYVGHLNNGGQALSDEVRDFYEPRFGYDFSQVRVHTDTVAAKSAQSINALAYTNGNNVVFNNGQYAPDTESGKRLLGHELTHVVQQRAIHSVQPKVIQRDLAIEPTVENPPEVVLTRRQMQDAIRLDTVMFTDATEIEIVRDILGISKQPAVVDEEFVNAVVRYQGSFGLGSDGILGPRTSGRLAREITAEADFMGDPPVGTPLRRLARRFTLRSMVRVRSGTLVHQGFTGPDANPEGIISVRIGGNETGMSPLATRAISLDYTGRNADNVRWLQFTSIHMSATQPGNAAPTNRTGTVNVCGNNHTWSTLAAPNWNVDSCDAAVPFYDPAHINVRTPGRSIVVADQPQGFLPQGQAFAASLAPAPTTVTAVFNFDSYAVANGTTPVYHVRWRAHYTYNITAGTESVIRYRIPGGGPIRRLTAGHRAAIDARYPGNGVL
ncbi:eCIS core domain-containing protein [Lunatibacter salilacus]|uniref:eCIS core domain-containing protein n=1 Tax=Lunatibacter salilacus TaxID=2483804 RepID=UPI00131DD737|nr:DUF4157 domain-containing protein [Lunatibacter salilacus]